MLLLSALISVFCGFLGAFIPMWYVSRRFGQALEAKQKRQDLALWMDYQHREELKDDLQPTDLDVLERRFKE